MRECLLLATDIILFKKVMVAGGDGCWVHWLPSGNARLFCRLL